MIGGMILGWESSSTWRKTYLSATFRTKNTIWTGLALNLGLHGETPATNYPSHEWTVCDFSSAPSGEFQDSTTNWATTASVYFVSFSLFTIHPTIRRYIIFGLLLVSLNTPQLHRLMEAIVFW